MLVGPPGVGKSIAIGAVRNIMLKLDSFKLGPISMTGASLVDEMAKATKEYYVHENNNEQVRYNSLLIMPDDFQALLPQHNAEILANLTIFYDTNPYIQTRRTGEVQRVEIASPQLSMLIGTTNSHLTTLLKPADWEQGFMSRVIMVHSTDRPQNPDIFAPITKTSTEDLEHDLHCIYSLRGQLIPTDPFRDAIKDWRGRGMVPHPDHPRLKNYCSRRLVHLLKLAIISSVDRGDSLSLDLQDFERAHSWLVSAERAMPDVFSGAGTPDALAMQEIVHMIGRDEVMETKLTRLVAERVSAHMVKRVIEIMLDAGMIKQSGVTRQGVRLFRAVS